MAKWWMEEGAAAHERKAQIGTDVFGNQLSYSRIQHELKWQDNYEKMAGIFAKMEEGKPVADYEKSWVIGNLKQARDVDKRLGRGTLQFWVNRMQAIIDMMEKT